MRSPQSASPARFSRQDKLETCPRLRKTRAVISFHKMPSEKLPLVELIWDRKYDGSGRKSAPVSVALPFQTIETLNESSQQRQKSIESFLSGRGATEWRNRLIWGDKKYVLPSLLPEFANSVDLIYIDPPFDTGADFSYLVEIPDHQVDTASFTKIPNVIEQKAYRDTWGQGRPISILILDGFTKRYSS